MIFNSIKNNHRDEKKGPKISDKVSYELFWAELREQIETRSTAQNSKMFFDKF